MPSGIDRPKVYVCYSRSEEHFADQLQAVLEHRGFEPIVDRRDINAGEAWEARLSTLHEMCDAFIFVLSERSGRSDVSEWELAQAERLGKPIFPVVVQRVPEMGTPPSLRKYQYIWFIDDSDIPGAGVLRGAVTLEKALREHFPAPEPSAPKPVAQRRKRGLFQSQSVFLSYRRADTELIAGRVHDSLCNAFGKRHVFFDVDSIPGGVDFRTHITSVLEACDAIVFLIGPNWADGGRLAHQTDPVRLEIETAYELGVPMFPLLIGNAKPPAESDLPAKLRRFSAVNALRIDPGRDYHAHIKRAVQEIRRRGA